MIINQAARFNFGFASNMVLLLWCVCGGFLLHMFEANYLTILLKPNYEKAVDTLQDVIDRGLNNIFYPGSESIRDLMKNSPYKNIRTLAERTIVCKDWEECDGKPFGTGLIPEAVKTGSSVVEAGLLYAEYMELGKWHRSKERKPGKYPFPSYLLNKKWTLEEEFNKHMMRFQQVTVSSINCNKLYFDIPGWIDSH